MNGVWVVRWDRLADPGPRVLDAAGRPYTGPGLHATASGGFIAFSGYLFDRAELDLSDAPEAALVASAYGRWKDALFEKISGGFALAVWDPERQRLTVGRDAMGLHPCYYCCEGATWLVSPSLEALLARPEVSREFNRVVISEYLQNALTTHQVGETFYEAIRRLPSAHVLAVDASGSALRRYWDPVPPGFAWASEDELGRFPALLEHAVTRCLAVGADSLALSGGFDSVSIAALAALQRGERAPLHAVSLRFDGTACDEGETQGAVAHALGMPQTVLTIDESLDGQTFVDAALALSATSPSPVLSPWQSLYTGLLRSAAGHGRHRLVLGTGGDDVLTVDLSYGTDLLSRLDLPGLWRYCRAQQRSSPFSGSRVARLVLWDGAAAPILKGAARRALNATPAGAAWLRARRRRVSASAWSTPPDPALRAAVEERQASQTPTPMASGEGRYVRAMRRLPQAPLLMIEHDQAFAWAAHEGFTLLYPYFDRDVIELTLRMHPEHLISGGRVKAPLRRLVADRLPHVPMRTRKVDFTGVGGDVLRARGARAWNRLGSGTMLERLGLAESERVNQMLQDFTRDPDCPWLSAWLALSTEMWLGARSKPQAAAVMGGPS